MGERSEALDRDLLLGAGVQECQERGHRPGLEDGEAVRGAADRQVRERARGDGRQREVAAGEEDLGERGDDAGVGERIAALGRVRHVADGARRLERHVRLRPAAEELDQEREAAGEGDGVGRGRGVDRQVAQGARRDGRQLVQRGRRAEHLDELRDGVGGDDRLAVRAAVGEGAQRAGGLQAEGGRRGGGGGGGAGGRLLAAPSAGGGGAVVCGRRR